MDIFNNCYTKHKLKITQVYKFNNNQCYLKYFINKNYNATNGKISLKLFIHFQNINNTIKLNVKKLYKKL